jgi:hypothetical protein
VFGDDSVIKGRLGGSLYRLGDGKRVAGWLGVLSARPAVGESNREERRGRDRGGEEGRLAGSHRQGLVWVWRIERGAVVRPYQ